MYIICSSLNEWSIGQALVKIFHYPGSNSLAEVFCKKNAKNEETKLVKVYNLHQSSRFNEWSIGTAKFSSWSAVQIFFA